jgi:ubiquinone/menaquinone biosynthesis C-methylase UbiE
MDIKTNKLSSENKYTLMQKKKYDREGTQVGKGMDKENHKFHNDNPDYWNILVKDVELNYKDKIGLDFACGCGRNILNLWKNFKRFDGVDISPNLIKLTKKNLLNENIPEDRFSLFVCNGIDLSIIENNQYDFIMSTIALQHICVYDIRFSYLSEFYRILKNDGLLSFQMGYGIGWGRVGYHENFYDATKTNSGCDVIVKNPEEIINDLKKIGYVDIDYKIRSSFSDGHPNWIFVKCRKSI